MKTLFNFIRQSKSKTLYHLVEVAPYKEKPTLRFIVSTPLFHDELDKFIRARVYGFGRKFDINVCEWSDNIKDISVCGGIPETEVYSLDSLARFLDTLSTKPQEQQCYYRAVIFGIPNMFSPRVNTRFDDARSELETAISSIYGSYDGHENCGTVAVYDSYDDAVKSVTIKPEFSL